MCDPILDAANGVPEPIRRIDPEEDPVVIAVQAASRATVHVQDTVQRSDQLFAGHFFVEIHGYEIAHNTYSLRALTLGSDFQRTPFVRATGLHTAPEAVQLHLADMYNAFLDAADLGAETFNGIALQNYPSETVETAVGAAALFQDTVQCSDQLISCYFLLEGNG